jgi:murein DD-endopeptidase MepM/ murein hydrolase activator NlpD
MYPTGFGVGSYGNYVRIDHVDYQTGYAHLQNLAVSNGREVKRGEVIGWVGSTGLSSGYHLHFEVWQDGERVNPAEWLPLQSQ